MDAGKELYSKANEAFVDEKYEDAAKLYSDAIEIDTTIELYYVGRAHAYIKLQRYRDALSDADKALQIQPQSTKALLRKGVALYNLSDYVNAQQAFLTAQSLDVSDAGLSDWVKKCDEALQRNLGLGCCSDFEAHHQPKPATDEATVAEGGETSAVLKAGEQSAARVTQSDPAPVIPQMPTGPKTRYEWYQTETHVVVSLLLKKVKKEDLHCDIQATSLSVSVRLDTGSDYSIELELSHPVVPDSSTVKILSTRVEIKLKKADGIRWQTLKFDESQKKVKHIEPTAAADVHPYPTSTHVTRRDWDKLVTDIKAEEKDEKVEGDAALNKLFQQIYADASEETKRAMNKSFVESGGTVLSTNWKEIGAKPVECKPPDGMEFKKWEY